MLELLKNKASGKRIVILGFGLEGQSTLKFLLSTQEKLNLFVLDRNEEIANHRIIIENQIPFYGGDDYLNHLKVEDFIIKSPGVKLSSHWEGEKSHSQTSLFLEKYGRQVIGVTGTKGKSTTSTMIYRILKDQNQDAILVGNIGQPAFNLVANITEKTRVVYELSAHQLQCVDHGPACAILLNLMPEHLDYFQNKESYYKAKLNIFKSANEKTFSFLSKESLSIASVYNSIVPTKLKTQLLQNQIFYQDELLLEENDLQYLLGHHHIHNIHAVIELVLHLELDLGQAIESIKNFHPLPHRQEFLGEKNGIRFINDSISTIPQSAIQAIKAIGQVDYLILGGFDRGIDYNDLVEFLAKTSYKKIFFLGLAGRRILKELREEQTLMNFNFRWYEKLQDIKDELLQIKSGTVLLSPAAASYDAFKNFEERGDYFRSIFSEIN